MSLTTSIPRFLLPQRGLIWRARLPAPSTTFQTIRRASNKASPKPGFKPFVLEKPTKFNPPSHGSRRPKTAPRYPGPELSAEEKSLQERKKYPTMMPPEGTFWHWFLTNRVIHMYIALGTLFTLASVVFVTNFQRNSPFADMIPPWSDMFMHPVAFCRRWVEIVRLNTAHQTAETQERRKRKVEDVAKRAAYRKAHGYDLDENLGGWTAKSDGQLLGPAIPTGDEASHEGAPVQEEPVVRKKKPVKMWLGIW